jgi:hypothetical protein
MFDHVQLGEEHHLWANQERGKETKRKISDEIRTWLRSVSIDLDQGRCKYKTIVLGGFNIIQEMILTEAMKYYPASKDAQQMWGYAAKWITELLQLINAFPAHVIIECGATVRAKDRNTGVANSWAPAVVGKGYGSILAGVNAIMFQSKGAGGRYMTSMAPSINYVAGVRLNSIACSQPIQNCCYDWFACRLGLPLIYEADPMHPRIVYNGRPEWPWAHSWDTQYL